MALAGIGVGSAAAVVDSYSGGMDKWRALDVVLNAGWLWAGVGILAGRVQSRARAAVLTALADLLLTVLAYYAVRSLQANGTLRFVSVPSHVLFIAVAGGPLLGFAGFWARRRDITGLAARLALPAAILVEELVIHPLNPAAFTVDPWLSWTHAAMVAVGVVLALASIVRWGLPASPAARDLAAR